MIRVSRRILGGLVLLAPAAAVLPAIPPAWAQIDTNRASAFIQASGTELVGVINNPGIPADQRRQKVADILPSSDKPADAAVEA